MHEARMIALPHHAPKAHIICTVRRTDSDVFPKTV